MIAPGLFLGPVDRVTERAVRREMAGVALGGGCSLIWTLRVMFLCWWGQGIFQDLEHGGCQPTLGSPFPSLLLSFSLSPSLPFPSLPHFPLKPGGCCAKVGGVWETPWVGVGVLEVLVLALAVVQEEASTFGLQNCGSQKNHWLFTALSPGD